ncbi:MAG TPA: hypothetical protein VF411_06635 [Bacteroidia bacterium]
MQRLTNILTYVALAIGILASLSCLSFPLLRIGMFCSIIGIIVSIFVIFQRTKYEAETKWNHPSIIALFLNSVPIIFLATLIFISKVKA